LLRIGLTGMIGSGKSEALAIFSSLGVGTISLDKISHLITRKDTPCYNQIVAKLGSQYLTKDKELARKKIRQLIFNNQELKLWLEQLLHPVIRQVCEQQIKELTTKYCIIEIPLLTAGNTYKFDRVLQVVASRDTRRFRIIDRDNIKPELALLMLDEQTSTYLLDKLADDTLDNNDSLVELQRKVIELNQFYLSIASC